MSYDVVIRDATVIDGSGAPRRRADIAVQNGSIAAIEPAIAGDGAEIIAADGLVASPGFIDSHTHLETQLFWDPVAGPATWHGSTTVILGNCGLSLAPIGPAGPGFAAGLMAAVEQIPQSVIDAAVPFDWHTFGEYFDSVERYGLPVNVASFVGYSVVRQAVMGDRAFDESGATDDDIERIRALLRESLASGALGISYNRATYDRDDQGRLMAGWNAPWSEMRRTAETLRDAPGTMLQVIPSWAELSAGWSEHNETELAEWTSILLDLDRPMVWSAVSERDYTVQMDATRRARAAGARMTAGIHSIPIYTFATLQAPGLFASTPGCDLLYAMPERERLDALRNPEIRERIRHQMGATTFSAYPLRKVSASGEEIVGIETVFTWDQVFRAGAAPGRFDLSESLAETGRRDGRHPVDILLDAALESDLREVFVVFVYGNLRDATKELLADPATVISSNDTGAHLMLMAQTQNTHLLDYWAGQSGHLSLEQAVHHLTGRQVDAFGLTDRGLLRPGWAADIVLFDPDSVGPRAPQLVDDLPGGGSRYISQGIGIERVIVNGTSVLVGGQPTGSSPGQIVRPAG